MEVCLMSNREMAINIINSLPDVQVDYALNLLKNFSAAVEEASDMAFCEKLYTDYLNDTDPQKNDGVLLEDFVNQLGVCL